MILENNLPGVCGPWSASVLRCGPGVPGCPVSVSMLQSRSNFGTSKWVSGVADGYSSGEASAVDCRPGSEAFRRYDG
jgi:hypothetical protein